MVDSRGRILHKAQAWYGRCKHNRKISKHEDRHLERLESARTSARSYIPNLRLCVETLDVLVFLHEFTVCQRVSDPRIGLNAWCKHNLVDL